MPAVADLRSLVTPELLRNPRRFYLNVLQGRNGPVMLTLSNRRWMDPITENPRVGAVEVWEIMNLANDFHPIHLHLLQFQLLNRQTFDLAAYKAALTAQRAAPFPALDPTPYLQGPPESPPPAEAGWKDTFIHRTHSVTRLVTRWAPQAAPLRGAGRAVPGVNLYPFDPTAGAAMSGIATTCSTKITR